MTKVRPCEHHPRYRHNRKDGVVQNASRFPVSQCVGNGMLELVHLSAVKYFAVQRICYLSNRCQSLIYSKTRSARKCYLCSRYKVSPMCPVWTELEWRARGDDFRTFLSELVSILPQTRISVGGTQAWL